MTFGGMLSFTAAVVLVAYLPEFYSQAYPDYNTECERDEERASTRVTNTYDRANRPTRCGLRVEVETLRAHGRDQSQ